MNNDRTRSRRQVLATVVTLSMMLAACGGDDGTEADTTSATSDAPAPTAASSDAPTAASTTPSTEAPAATMAPDPSAAPATTAPMENGVDPLTLPVEERVERVFDGLDFAEPETSTLRVPTVGTSTLNVGLWVAEDLGIFDRLGLDIEWEIANPGVQTSAFIAEEYDILNSTGTIAVNLLTQGVGIDIYAFPQPYQFFQVVGQPEYAELADVVDGRLGISAAGSVTQQTFEICFDRADLTVDDPNYAILEATSNMLPALEAGAVDAVAFSEPRVYQAEQAGYVNLCDLSNAGVLGTTGPIIVRESFATENPNTVENYLLGVAIGFHIALTDREVGEAAIRARDIDLSDPGLADAVYSEILAAAASPERGMAYPDELLALLKEQDAEPDRIELEVAQSARPETDFYADLTDPALFDHLYDALGEFPAGSQAASDWANR